MKKQKNSIKFMNHIMALIAIIFVLTGCLGEMPIEDTIPHQREETATPLYMPELLPPPEPQYGGTLRLSMRTPQTLNPLLNQDATVARVLQLLFEPLVMLDDELRPVPHLASLDFALDGSSVIVTIRGDAFWNDGSPVIARDLVHSLNILRGAPAGAIYRNRIENIFYYEAIDERSVRVYFTSPQGGAAYMFNFPIIPSSYFDPMAPMGNGPYMFSNYTPGESVQLIRNPFTFRSPFIGQVDVMITRDALTDLYAFDRGLVDVYQAEMMEWSRHRSIKPVEFSIYAAMSYEFIGFNFARALPRQPEFRQAIAHSLDIDRILGDAFLTHAVRTTTPIHPHSWLHEPNTHVFEFDMERAERLAMQVHPLWPRDEQGEMRPLEVLVNWNNREGLVVAQAVVDQMNAIGMPAEWVPIPFDVLQARLREGEFDLFVGGYYFSFRPDIRFAFHSESPDNLLSYYDPVLDRLLEAVVIGVTDSQYQRALADMQKHFAEQLPVISLAFRHSALITDRRIHGQFGGLNPSPDNIFANVHEWFVADWR